MRALITAWILAVPALGAVTVTDDAGRQVTLKAPAQRIISTSPHVTELLYAAGGGNRIVGAMNYSDYPEEAKKIPLIGDNANIDVERVVALKPDLLVVWQTGNTARQLEQLARLGIPIFYSEPQKLEEVASSLARFGKLMGTEAKANAAAADYRARIAALEAKYAKRPAVRVFYQIWDKPLYTLNDKHIASDVLRVCGGHNIFGQLKVIAPEVSTEAVLQENPEVIIGGDQYDPKDKGLNIWKGYQTLTAVQRGNLFNMGGELLTRAGPRTAEGAARLCARLEEARGRRAGQRRP
jgi:iron complex transport system substrate-binding protein